VIAGLLGVPQDERAKLFRWTNEMTGNEDPEFAHVDGRASSIEVLMYAMQLAAIKAQEPGDDIVTALINADVDGEKLTDDEFGFFVLGGSQSSLACRDPHSAADACPHQHQRPPCTHRGPVRRREASRPRAGLVLG
jgi:hypothetical protein